MPTLVAKLVRLLGMAIAALIGIAMALIFVCSSLIAIAVLLVTGKLTGRPSALKEYFMRAQASRKPIFGTGVLRSRPSQQDADIIDVEAKEIK